MTQTLYIATDVTGRLRLAVGTMSELAALIADGILPVDARMVRA